MSFLKRILLVEDSPRDAELTLDALAENHLGHSVAHVRDGAEALDYLHRRGPFAERPDDLPALVLLDLKMPRMDGIEVLRQMRGDPRLKPVPVVMMTSSREAQDLEKSYALGANAYVVKPVEFAEFVAAVREVGMFWAGLNEPPPGCLARAGSAGI